MSSPVVGIIGLGLIGGSLARRLSPTHTVLGWDSSPSTAAAARTTGIAVADSLSGLCGSADLIFVATPLRAMPEMFAGISSAIADRGDVSVTDVGSVKSPVAEWARAAGLSSVFVPGHPMAGTERSGFDNADPALFEGATWALCVSSDFDLARWLQVADLLITSTGCKILSPAPDDHDEAAATISHAPHVISSAVLNSLGSDPHPALAAAMAAGSFASMTRVAGTNPDRTEAMVVENGEKTAVRLRELATQLEMVAARLEAHEPVSEFFRSAAGVRSAVASKTRKPTRMALGDDAAATLIELARAGRLIVAVDVDRLEIDVD